MPVCRVGCCRELGLVSGVVFLSLWIFPDGEASVRLAAGPTLLDDR